MRSRIVDRDEARDLSPLFAWDDVLAACWSPDDGHCTPEAVVAGYAGGARRAGAGLVTGVEVIDVELAAGAVSAVRWRTGGTDPGGADEGVLRASTVLCCAGAWSHAIGAMVGVDLPVTPYRRELVVTGPVPELPAQHPDDDRRGYVAVPARRGPGAARRVVRPGRRSRLRPRARPGVPGADRAAGGGTCTRAARRRHRRRLVRAVRGDAGPQRHRRVRTRRRVRVRDRLQRSRVPAGPGGRRDPARQRPGPHARAGRLSAVRRSGSRPDPPGPNGTSCSCCCASGSSRQSRRRPARSRRRGSGPGSSPRRAPPTRSRRPSAARPCRRSMPATR